MCWKDCYHLFTCARLRWCAKTKVTTNAFWGNCAANSKFCALEEKTQKTAWRQAERSRALVEKGLVSISWHRHNIWAHIGMSACYDIFIKSYSCSWINHKSGPQTMEQSGLSQDNLGPCRPQIEPSKSSHRTVLLNYRTPFCSPRMIRLPCGPINKPVFICNCSTTLGSIL